MSDRKSVTESYKIGNHRLVPIADTVRSNYQSGTLKPGEPVLVPDARWSSIQFWLDEKTGIVVSDPGAYDSFLRSVGLVSNEVNTKENN